MTQASPSPILQAQNYDGLRSAPNAKLTLSETARNSLNGGSTAILVWAVPLFVALLIAIILFSRSRRRSQA